jgi:YrbI family 3-deoxy-D-manno-octulosonate 8-phosphate phosphatase
MWQKEITKKENLLMNHNFEKIEAVAFDFDGVFTNNKVIVSQNGEESVICSRSDGMGLAKLKKLSMPLIIISTEINEVVSRRAEKLGIPVKQSVANKDIAIKEWSESIGISLDKIAFFGNDENDLPALKNVGFPIGVADSVERVRNATIFLTEAMGGNGAVREVCELIYAAKSSDNAFDAFRTVFPEPKDMGERVWGQELQLAIAPGRVMMKKLTLKAGCKGGLQYHRKRFEMGYVISGKMIVRVGTGEEVKEVVVQAGDHFYFPPYLVHQEEAVEDTVILECSNTWANDRVRVEELYDFPDGDVGLRSSLPGEEILL